MSKTIDSCTFGLVLEQKVKDTEKNMQEGFKRVLKSIEEMKTDVKDLSTEVMERPSKQATRQVNILLSLCAGLTGAVVTLISVLIYGAGL